LESMESYTRVRKILWRSKGEGGGGSGYKKHDVTERAIKPGRGGPQEQKKYLVKKAQVVPHCVDAYYLRGWNGQGGQGVRHLQSAPKVWTKKTGVDI